MCLCRLWSFSKRQLVLDKQLADDPLCVSLHPTGFMMLIGCVDRLRLYFVVRSVQGAVLRACWLLPCICLRTTCCLCMKYHHSLMRKGEKQCHSVQEALGVGWPPATKGVLSVASHQAAIMQGRGGAGGGVASQAL